MKYFVFDVDGTLMNSAAVDQQCLKQTLHEFGRDYTFEELRPSFGKPGRQTLADLGFTGETAERIMDRWEGLSKERASRCSPSTASRRCCASCTHAAAAAAS